MRKTILNTFILSMAVSAGPLVAQPIPTHPADPQATAATCQLYGDLLQRWGQQTIPCSMADVSWNYDLARQAHTLTGYWPPMNCFDLLHLCYSPSGWIDYGDITPVSEWHQMGGITALMWHWQVPAAQPAPGANADGYTSTASLTTFSPANINTEGSWEHQLFYTDLWEAYTVLRQLQDVGIPVLWRPFHEAAGNVPNGGEAWFWWGKDGAGVFKQLWRRMYSYFQDLGIHNLIWVWTSCDDDPDWYPGDDCVDIIGTDSYRQDVLTLSRRFAELRQRYPHRMLALTECGQAPYVSIQQEQNACWLWAMPWYGCSDDGRPWATDAWWQDAISRYLQTSGITGRPMSGSPAAAVTVCHVSSHVSIVRMSDGSMRKVMR